MPAQLIVRDRDIGPTSNISPGGVVVSNVAIPEADHGDAALVAIRKHSGGTYSGWDISCTDVEDGIVRVQIVNRGTFSRQFHDDIKILLMKGTS